MTVSDIQARASKDLTAALVKEHLPILYVLEANDHYPALVEAGRHKFYSPFRPDNDPSFDVFKNAEGVERWGDFAESRQGDVLELIERFFESKIGRKPSFPEVMHEAAAYLETLHSSDWSGPQVQARKSFDIDAAKELYAKAIDEPSRELLERFLLKRSDTLQRLDPDWLQEEFRVGTLEDRILVPYFNRAGELVAYKHRIIGGPMISAPGSGMYDSVLYGEWRDQDITLPVVLCEGETDTWAAASQLGADYAVLGLPTGAGAQPKQAELLDGRTVYLAFDGDKAGRSGASRWIAALPATCHVLVVPMPDGLDIARITNLADLIPRARPALIRPDGAPVGRAWGYERPPEGKNTEAQVISNWTFDPERELHYDSGSAYDGLIMPLGRSTVLTSADLANKASAVRWASRNGGSWYGTDRDCQLLLADLQAQGVFLPAGRMTTVAGLHEGQFVWPDGQLGTDRWAYVPPATNVQLEKYLTLHPGKWNAAQLAVARELHAHAVMDPILCWLAVAPLRSLVAAFPVLAVTGGSGSGKTTLMETIAPWFSGSAIQSNLTGTTGYAVGAFAGSTNAFPVHFDEFRPGARRDTLEMFAQILRDAYTGQASSKGGMDRNNVSAVAQIEAIAPIIVTGEDSFSETSHTERMVLVHLPIEGKNPEVLDVVKTWPIGPFAYAYLKWLHEVYIEDYRVKLDLTPVGRKDLPPRTRHNLGVLKYGWALLQRFCEEHGYTLEGEPDLSLVAREAREAASSNPIRDALLWALDESDLDSGVAQPDAYTIAVRPETFVSFIQKKGTFVLPGGSQAVRKFLVAQYGAEETLAMMGGKSRTAYVMNRAAISR